MRALLFVSFAACLAGCEAVPLPPPPESPPPLGATSSVPSVSAAPGVPDRRALADVEALALRNDPALAAALLAYEAAGGREEQAGLWPNPSARFEARDVPRHPIALDRGGRWVELKQPVAAGGRIGAARDAATAEREALGWEVAAARRRVIADVRSVCADLAAAEESRRVREIVAADAARLADGARRRVETGTGSEADALLLALEAERAASDARRAGAEVAAARAALRALVGDAGDAIDAVEWPSATPDVAPGEPDAHPSMRAAAARIAAAERRADEARAARIPDVTVSVSYGRVGEESEEFVEGAVEVPLPVFDRQQGRIREADALVSAARSDAWVVRRNLVRRRDAATAARAAARADVEAHRERMVPAAEKVAAQVERAFEQGTRSATDAALARRAAADARLGLVAAERAWRRADAEWADVAGAAPQEDAR